MKVTIEQRPPICCRCECGTVGYVADLMAAIHWAWTEALRHGAGCDLEIVIDMTLSVRSEAPNRLGIP